jgi:hypothetical protein
MSMTGCERCEQQLFRRVEKWNAGWLRLLAVVFLAASGAKAWDPATATEAGPCQWSPVVRVGSCTGAYVGGGIVLTAAHCLWEQTNDLPPIPVLKSLNHLDVAFGEAEDVAELLVPVLGCFSHPDGEPDIAFTNELTYVGVDLAYCHLDVDTENEGFLAQVPVLPPMVPSGCARDWLSREMRGVAPGRPLAIATGMGCEEVDPCVNPGVKRFTGVEFLPELVDSKKFVISRFSNEDGSLGLKRGDSGGPLYVRLPDHTWRLIGVNSTTAGGDTAKIQSIPPYLGWIEHSSGVDITPCHTRIPQTSDYIFTGGCEGMLPLDPGVEETWMGGCAVTLGGPSDAAADECAEWPIGQPSTFLAPSL